MAKIATFTAKVQTPNSSQPRYIQNCTIVNGIIVQVIEIGVGEAIEKGGMNAYGEGETWEEYSSYETRYRPYFNANKLTRDNKKEEVVSYNDSLKSAYKVEQLQKYKEYCLFLGDNGDGYFVEDTEIAKQEKIAAEKKVSFQSHLCWETGITWYQLIGRYPEDVFNKMRPFLAYHNEQEEEEGDWKGWATTHHTLDIEEALKSIGWTIK